MYSCIRKEQRKFYYIYNYNYIYNKVYLVVYHLARWWAMGKAGWVGVKPNCLLFTVYPLHLTSTMWRPSLFWLSVIPARAVAGQEQESWQKMVPPRPHASTNAHPAPHDAKRIASYSIRQRFTKRGTLFLAISHSARGMLYLCKRKKDPPPAPPSMEGSSYNRLSGHTYNL